MDKFGLRIAFWSRIPYVVGWYREWWYVWQPKWGDSLSLNCFELNPILCYQSKHVIFVYILHLSSKTYKAGLAQNQIDWWVPWFLQSAGRSSLVPRRRHKGSGDLGTRPCTWGSSLVLVSGESGLGTRLRLHAAVPDRLLNCIDCCSAFAL